MNDYNINVIINNAIYMAKMEKTIHKELLFEKIEIVTQLSNQPSLIRCNQIELSLALYHLLKRRKKICNSPDVESLYYLFLWRIVFGLVVCSQTQSLF